MIVKDCLVDFVIAGTKKGKFYSLKKLAEQGLTQVLKLPMSLKIILESLLRNYDNNIITKEHIQSLVNWTPERSIDIEVPFFVSRVILQDYSGLPLLSDMTAMRETMEYLGKSADLINPMIPTSLIIDHSTETHYTGNKNAFQLNMDVEFQRNQERYQFLKWAACAYRNLEVIPPGSGIIHQINLEYLVKGVFRNTEGVYYPDTLIGTDSHTTMANGIGILGWGVGGIEAGAAMLGLPISLSIPDIVGVHLHGHLREGVTATDLVLTVTELLRKSKVVGKIVEYFGHGVSSLTAQERATISNMAPDYGAMMGLFPIDEKTIEYYQETGRAEEAVSEIVSYYEAQDLFGVPEHNDCDYGQVIYINLEEVRPSIAGPKRPQDRINFEHAGAVFEEMLVTPAENDGYGYNHLALKQKFPSRDKGISVEHGDIIIAAITSCTNTSNPQVLIAAGLLAKKAYEKGLRVKSHLKTSLTPGSKVVIEYLKKTGLLKYLENLGFFLAGYGCTTCVGNVGEINKIFEQAVLDNNIIVASVLSGNRNFEARIHPSVKANFLMSPPLVVAFAIAGTIRINLLTDPLGLDNEGRAIFLKDVWPSSEEINKALIETKNSYFYEQTYQNIKDGCSQWKAIETLYSNKYIFNSKSTLITKPPFFENFSSSPPVLYNILKAKILAILGDSITTDHISPVGSIEVNSPAGQYLIACGILPHELGSYGMRRGNHEVMMRGTFSNIRLKNKMLKQVEGGYTINHLAGQQESIYDTAMAYQKAGISSIIFAGEEYGCGSARDWAAKGTYFLGVKIVIAKSFERIHRSNLVCMGIIPCILSDNLNVDDLMLSGNEALDVFGLADMPIKRELSMSIYKPGSNLARTVKLIPVLKNSSELNYIYHGGILQFTLRKIIEQSETA